MTGFNINAKYFLLCIHSLNPVSRYRKPRHNSILRFILFSSKTAKVVCFLPYKYVCQFISHNATSDLPELFYSKNAPWYVTPLVTSRDVIEIIKETSSLYQRLLRIIPRVDVRSSELPRFLRTKMINEATYGHHFLGNGTDYAAEGPLHDDRSLEKYLARLGDLNERDGNDVGRLNDVISNRFCVYRPRLLHLNEQSEKRSPLESPLCLIPVDVLIIMTGSFHFEDSYIHQRRVASRWWSTFRGIAKSFAPRKANKSDFQVKRDSWHLYPS